MLATTLTISVFVLIAAHIIAAMVGAGSILLAEWQYFRATADGRIDEGERKHLVALFFSLRFALMVMLLVNVALGFLLFMIPDATTPGLTAVYWFEMLIIALLILVSWMRFHGRIAFWLGSAIAFTGWWYLLGIDLGYVPVAGFMSALAGFIVSTAVIAAVFGYGRFLIRARNA